MGKKNLIQMSIRQLKSELRKVESKTQELKSREKKILDLIKSKKQNCTPYELTFVKQAEEDSFASYLSIGFYTNDYSFNPIGTLLHQGTFPVICRLLTIPYQHRNLQEWLDNGGHIAYNSEELRGLHFSLSKYNGHVTLAIETYKYVIRIFDFSIDRAFTLNDRYVKTLSDDILISEVTNKIIRG